MIVEKNQENEAIYVGQIQENKVDIDRENIDFIASLLTTNLYSSPLESFLRETISNGEDAQKEAGVEDPLLMIITPDGDSHFKITIRDFGTGISEEKFDRIYRKIGTSTKRDSNEYIGHFGIGKFASLAVSDVVNIVSYYNNKRYDYLMYKNGDGINIDRISTKDGEYSNGLEITVRLSNSLRYSLNRILYRFCFFEKLFLVDNSHYVFSQDDLDRFNKRKIRYNNDIAMCDYISSETHTLRAVLYGKVLYPIDLSADNHSYIEGNLIYKFNIGELDVTPNRESLRYSTKTNQAIINKMINVTTLFNDEIVKQTSKGFDNITEWYKYMDSAYININVLNESYKIRQSKLTSTTVNTSVRGVSMSPEIYRLINIIKQHLSNDIIKYQISNKTFFSGRHCWVPTERLLGVSNVTTFLVTEDTQYSSITKKYILTQIPSTYPNSVYVLNKKGLEVFKKELAFRFLNALRQPALYNISIKRNDDNTKKSIKVIFEDVDKIINSFVCINNKDVPKSFKDSLKPAKIVGTTKKDKKEVRSCVVEKLKEKEIYCSSNYARDHVSVDTTYDLHELLTKFKNCLIVYGSKNDSTIKTIASLYFRSNRDSSYIFVQVADSKLILLKNYRNTIEVNDFITSNIKKLRNLATIKNIRDNYKEIAYITNLKPSSYIFKCVHSKYIDRLKDISSLFSKYNRTYEYNSRFKDIMDIVNVYINENWYEDYSDVINNPFMQKLIKIQYSTLKDGYNEENNYLFIFYLSKCKQVLPNTDAYVNFKNR